mgnify:CR=1 FL=1
MPPQLVDTLPPGCLVSIVILCYYSQRKRAEVVELEDTWCSGRHERNARVGSNPTFGTIFFTPRGRGRLALLRRQVAMV